jgi:hypothetical protein
MSGTQVWLAASTIALGAVAVSARQAPPAQPPPQFRSSIDTVHLDVSVSGSLYADVDVPDITRTPLTMTAMLFAVSPNLVTAPPDALKGVVDISPTTRRTFGDRDRVGAFARLYQGRKTVLVAVPVRVRIVDARGRTVFDRTQDLGADRFTAQRSADILFAVPVTDLDDGEYLLSFEAGAAGSVARRDTRFRVARR